ncbi:glucose-6-phosphate dehydrogenase [Microbacterium sp. P06]|uniref:glucose-6-phosphate dehydrogenase n=1 Tax=unclassified Microbacterium TaxID=2609290 RepID=UPI0037475A17
MRVVSSADWRDGIPFETPMIVADLAPGEPTRCFVCGASSEPRPREELWVVKHRHPNDHGGFVRFYCEEHRPVFVTPVVEYAGRSRPAPRREPREAPARRAPVVEKQREMCPNCFVEVSATGECGMCGWTA